MSLLRLIAGLITAALAVACAQSADRTRAKEDALRRSLFILRQGIDKYTADQHKAPKTLQELVARGYVENIPVDPMTESSSTWRVVMEDPAQRADPDEPGIFDVRSGSNGVSPDGTRYADW